VLAISADVIDTIRDHPVDLRSTVELVHVSIRAPETIIASISDEGVVTGAADEDVAPAFAEETIVTCFTPALVV